uniref:KNOTTED1-like protein n=1 Tax=Selaginella kraussiana TaxID=81964 RepID=Q5GAB6_9TRAC|nr:KNOTTED1-like protein [Selaginella kraussiana]
MTSAAASSSSKFTAPASTMDEWYMLSSYQSLIDANEGLEHAAGALEHHQQQQSSSSKQKSSLQLSEKEMKAAISGHPQYLELIKAHMSIKKVGASSQKVAEINEVIRMHQDSQPSSVHTNIGANPELDQFMVAYCDVLNMYENQLNKAFTGAIEYCKQQEQELKLVSVSDEPIDALSSVELDDDVEDDEEAESDDVAADGGDIDPLIGDKEIKRALMKKYGGYLGGLTQEYLKKKKKSKLPSAATKTLRDWWFQHLEHPYPSEAQKATLAATTKLDPKQINNWFINQRKRHWDPSAAAASARGESLQQQGSQDGD